MTKRTISVLDNDIPEFIWGLKFDMQVGLVSKTVKKMYWNPTANYFETRDTSHMFTSVIGLDDKWVEDDGEFYFTSKNKQEVELMMKTIKCVTSIFKLNIGMLWNMVK